MDIKVVVEAVGKDRTPKGEKSEKIRGWGQTRAVLPQ